MLVNSKFALLKISLELIPEMNTLVSSAKEIPRTELQAIVEVIDIQNKQQMV